MRALLACLTLAATVGVTGTAPAHAEDTAPACPLPGAIIPAAALPASFSDQGCSWDEVTITAGGAAAGVPPRGLAVSANVSYPDGADDLSVSHALDGSITVDGEQHSADGVIPGEVAPGTPGKCVDDVYGRKSWKMPATGFRYSYTPTNEPANVTASAATVVQAGATTISQAQDACDRGTPVGIPGYTYVGTNTRRPNFDVSATLIGCGAARDGVSIVGWLNYNVPDHVGGSVPFAETCVWSTPPPVGTQSASNPGIVAEVDIALNSHYPWFTGPVPAGCANRVDLHSAMAHEWGHGWGLAHPAPDGAHGNLTMSDYQDYCSTAHRSLGYGDVKGLDARYP